MSGLPSLAALEGSWSLRRRIVHADGREDRFEGVSRFVRSGHRLIQDEEGSLVLSGAPEGFTATRRYIWESSPGRVEVMFDANRPFHSIPIQTERPETTYLCSPDRYHVAYDFSDWPEWRSIWTVEGPRKDYVMTTQYSPAR